MHKPSLSFYTNIPTPYQLSFFEALAEYFTLTVIYYAVTENNREWKFSTPETYSVIVLKDNIIARTIQRWVLDFHFSWNVFAVTFNDKSNHVIVGGGYATPNATVALFVARLKNKKVAYFSEPLFEVSSRIKYWLKWLYLRILNFCCDAIFCVGKKAALSFEKYAVTPTKYIIPYNIDEKAFSQLNETKVEEFKKRYKSNNEIIILSSGALIQRKGMDVLIKAIKDISNPDLRLIIIGNGPDKKYLLDLANGDPRILLHGFSAADEVPYFYAISDVFAFASRYDGWAVVINEAIAANLPIVSSNKVGAAIELLTHEIDGLLCESDDIDAFSTAISSLVEDKSKRLYIKTNAAKLTQLISSAHNAKMVYEIFKKKIN